MTEAGEYATESVVLDASAMVNLLANTDYADGVADRIRGTVLHAPTLFDAEVLSALGRIQRAGELSARDVEAALTQLAAAPVSRHALPGLLSGSWARRAELRLTDALYVELATQLGVVLLTTDHRLARACPIAEAITGQASQPHEPYP